MTVDLMAKWDREGSLAWGRAIGSGLHYPVTRQGPFMTFSIRGMQADGSQLILVEPPFCSQPPPCACTQPYKCIGPQRRLSRRWESPALFLSLTLFTRAPPANWWVRHLVRKGWVLILGNILWNSVLVLITSGTAYSSPTLNTEGLTECLLTGGAQLGLRSLQLLLLLCSITDICSIMMRVIY